MTFPNPEYCREHRVTRRHFLNVAGAGIAAATTSSFALTACANESNDAVAIPGFEPDLNGLMSVRHQWALKIHRQAEDLRRKEQAAHDALRTPKDVAAWGRTVRQHYLTTFGGLPARPNRVQHEVLRELESDGVRIEVFRFESFPGFVVPGLVFHSTKPGPGPGVFLAHGHIPRGKVDGEYQRLAIELARHGFTVLIIDWMGLGERMSWLRPDGTIVRAGSHEHNYMGLPCYLTGHNIGRYMVHDASCGITVLASLPAVDPERIAVAGHSGGGLMTTYLAMLDERVRAAVAVCYVCDFHRRIVTANGFDAESLIPGGMALGINSVDALATLIPRPTLLGGVESDIFPTEGFLAETKRLKAMYEAAGAAENTEHFLSLGKHAYNEAMRKETVRFLSKHLGGPKSLALRDDSEIRIREPRELWVSKSGQVYRDNPHLLKPNDLHRRFWKEFTRPKLPRERIPGTLEGLLGIDTKKALASAVYPKYVTTRAVPGGVACHLGIVSEYNLDLGGVCFRPEKVSGEAWLFLTERGANEVESQNTMALKQVAAGATVLFADTRGRGAVESALINGKHRFERYGTEAWFQNYSVMMGSSAVAQRTHDVLRWFAYLETLRYPASAVHVLAAGTAGFAALFASVLAGPPRSFKWTDPLPDWDEVIASPHYDYDRFKQGLIVFGIARQFSMAELLAFVGN